ncbi:MAG: thioredoxin domain-containing protein [Sulfurovum sp.]
MSNHLKNEESPYLLQHADNPVDWYPWGEEAFSKAKKENKSIFLSIGYSSCHWCHVMERESFEDEDTAKILNDNFISIKVDREERPDIDKHFQEVYQLMNAKAGGWPTSIFLTQELKPFYSATYIPDEPRYGMRSFTSLLEIIADKYKNEKALLTEKAEEVIEFLNKKDTKIEATKLDISVIKKVVTQAKSLFDNVNGGFNKAPKFPLTSTLNMLLDVYRLTDDKDTLNMVLLSLSSMAKGGLRDLVDGGFCRYSTDEAWLIPHFEKMTYDNALLSEVYLKAYSISNNSFYKDVAFETLDFMTDYMSEDNLFYSASDADTQGVEGKYFVYEYNEVIEAFAKTGIPAKNIKILEKHLNITENGNFEGKNIIRLNDAKDTGIEFYDKAIEVLQEIRKDRLYPFIDKKIIVSWNAMMIKSLFIASRVDNKYLSQAINSIDKLLKNLYINDKLFHSMLPKGTPKIRAFLEDYAYLCDALIEAYKSTLDEEYLIIATKLANSSIEKYYNNGKWKFSRGEFETDADSYDSSYPSSVSVMINALYSLSSLVDIIYKKFVFKTLEIDSYNLMRQPISTAKMTHILIRYLKDDIIIKSKESNLIGHIKEIDTLPYPFVLFKNDINEDFMLCNSTVCFGDTKEWNNINGIIERR